MQSKPGKVIIISMLTTMMLTMTMMDVDEVEDVDALDVAVVVLVVVVLAVAVAPCCSIKSSFQEMPFSTDRGQYCSMILAFQLEKQ